MNPLQSDRKSHIRGGIRLRSVVAPEHRGAFQPESGRARPGGRVQLGAGGGSGPRSKLDVGSGRRRLRRWGLYGQADPDQRSALPSEEVAEVKPLNENNADVHEEFGPAADQPPRRWTARWRRGGGGVICAAL